MSPWERPGTPSAVEVEARSWTTSSFAADAIVDGTGSAARNGDVAIKDGIITAVGKVGGQARRTIDARRRFW